MRLSTVSQFINKIGLIIARLTKYSTGIGYPSSLQIEPTNFCNARCPLCPTGANQLRRKKGFMELSLFKKIINEISGKTYSITFWNYGEPFLHPQIFEMIGYAKQHRMYTVASTNGYVFYSNDSINKLANSQLDTLIVSLDGANEKSFSLYRKNVDFKKIIKGLKKLKKIKQKNQKKPHIEIQFIVMKHNEKELEKVKQIAEDLGDSLRIKTVNTHMVKKIFPSDWLPTKAIFSRYIKDDNGRLIPKKQNFYNCPVIWASLTINWDGMVNPCCYDYQGEVIIGNANKEKIKDIWKGERMKNFRRSILTDRRKNKICRNCPIDLIREKIILLPKS